MEAVRRTSNRPPPHTACGAPLVPESQYFSAAYAAAPPRKTFTFKDEKIGSGIYCGHAYRLELLDLVARASFVRQLSKGTFTPVTSTSTVIPHGDGTYIMANGTRIVGAFTHGNPTHAQIFLPGWGETFAYNGEFKDGQKHGCGSEHGGDGSHYVGEFNEGVRHGEGRLTTGHVTYEGEFLQKEFLMALANLPTQLLLTPLQSAQGEWKQESVWENGSRHVKVESNTHTHLLPSMVQVGHSRK